MTFNFRHTSRACNFRHTSRACPDGPHAEFPLVDQMAIRAVLRGADERYDLLVREYCRASGAAEVPPGEPPTEVDPGGSVHALVLFEDAAKAAGIPPAARRWIVPYVVAMHGWFLIQRPPHQMLLYGGLRAFERFGAQISRELPFLADFARHQRARVEAIGRPI
jgi:hypothetical protein